jgi:bifunctional DNase/RNase
MLNEMQVKGIALDPLTNVPIVILKGINSTKSLPIWIGIFEANAIISQIEDITPARPMTHDLIKNIIEGVDSRVVSVIVTDLVDNTFYANIELLVNGNKVRIDSRPSDAIALALRVKAPIYVDDEVINKAKKVDIPDGKNKDKLEKWKEWLENSNPEDFGKYKM